MFKFIGQCDNCGRNFYEGDVRFVGQLGGVSFELCNQCCRVHDGTMELVILPRTEADEEDGD